MTYENENGTLTDLSSTAESNMSVQEPDTVRADSIDSDSHCGSDFGEMELPCESDRQRERAEYERLIRTRFKEFYTDDTQKMINKRFKRYKAMEERIGELEGQAEDAQKRQSEFDDLLRSECERVERETEERVVSAMMASQRRPAENGYSPRRAPAPFDVTKLTKSQRAEIAKRASGGEKISF